MYAPIAFRHFRDLFSIQPDDYLVSVTNCYFVINLKLKLKNNYVNILEFGRTHELKKKKFNDKNNIYACIFKVLSITIILYYTWLKFHML